MKLVTFQAHPASAGGRPARLEGYRSPGAPRAGILLGERVLDVSQALTEMRLRWPERAPGEMGLLASTVSVLDLLGLGSQALRQLASACEEVAPQTLGNGAVDAPWNYPLEEVALLAPLPRPLTIRDFMAFEAHVERVRASRSQSVPPEWYQMPVFYFTNPGAVFGPGEEVPFPAPWTCLDYELEVACVIGRAGIDIPEERAEEHIAGYTIMNDWSARDVQGREMSVGLGPAKGKDFATSLGPYLVTPDEIEQFRAGPGRYRLGMAARVNGSVYSRGSFEDIHWTFPQMIAWASRNACLYPGDVLASGTVGTGCILELGAEKYGWLKPGDRVDLEVDGLGGLSNTVGRPRPEGVRRPCTRNRAP